MRKCTAFLLLLSGVVTVVQHILLFSDRRDCSHSIEQACASKIYVSEGGISASQPTNATIGVVEDIIDRYTGSWKRTKVVLFTYSLSAKPNGLLSQLACRLDGIHVDLEKELQKGRRRSF